MDSYVTPVYASVLALMFCVLAFRTLILRRRLTIAVGDGGNAVLQRAIRVHGNFAEYTPLALLLVWWLELRSENLLWIHTLCGALIVGRLIHAFGVSQVQENYNLRTAGMFLTFTVIISASLRILAGTLMGIV